MKRINHLVSFLILVLAAGINTHAQSNEQNVTLTIKPSQTVEERVADSIKERELREAAEDKLASEKSASIAAMGARSLLGRARTIFVSSGTSYFEPVQLHNALLKRSEFEAWQLAIIDGHGKLNIADILIEVDRPLFTFSFTYKVTDRSTGVLLTTGKVTAWDGNEAAPLLAGRILADIKKARGEAVNRK
jgi:hypothetical protein